MATSRTYLLAALVATVTMSPTTAQAALIPVHGHIGNLPIAKGSVVEEHYEEREPTSPQEAGPFHATMRPFGGLASVPVEYDVHYSLTITQYQHCGNCGVFASLAPTRMTVTHFWIPWAGEPEGPNPAHQNGSGNATPPISCKPTNKPQPTPDLGTSATTLPEGTRSGTAGEGWATNFIESCTATSLLEPETIWFDGSVDRGIFYPNYEKERSFTWEVTEEQEAKPLVKARVR